MFKLNLVIFFLCFCRRGIDFLNKVLTAIGNKIITEVQLNKVLYISYLMYLIEREIVCTCNKFLLMY